MYSTEVSILDIDWIYKENEYRGKQSYNFLDYIKALKNMQKQDESVMLKFYNSDFIKSIHKIFYLQYFFYIIAVLIGPLVIYFLTMNAVFSLQILDTVQEGSYYDLQFYERAILVVAIFLNIYFSSINIIQIFMDI